MTNPNGLNHDTQAMMRYDANKKSMLIAYLLAIFVGTLGLHRFYLGEKNTAIAQLVMTIAGWLTIWIFIGALPLMAVGIWVLVDLFLIPGLVAKQNNKLIASLNQGL